MRMIVFWGGVPPFWETNLSAKCPEIEGLQTANNSSNNQNYMNQYCNVRVVVIFKQYG